MSNNYGILGLGANYMSDPYFMAALQAYNPNFKSAQSTQEAQLKALQAMYQQAAASDSATQTTTQAASAALNNELTENNDGISAGKILVGGALATAAIAGYIYTRGKGNGNFIEGAKNIWNSLRTKGTSIKQNIESPSTTISARRINGKNIYTIPEHKITIKDKIAEFAQQNGIDLTPDKLKFSTNYSKIVGANFKHKVENDVYTIAIKDGNFEIFDKNHNPLKELWTKDSGKTSILADISKRVDTVLSGNIKGNLPAFRNLANIEYVNTVGDDVITIVTNTLNNSGHAAKKQIKELTTLKRFTEDANEVQAYFKNHPGVQELFTSKNIKKGKLPEQLTPKSFNATIGQNVFHFDRGNVVGVEINGRFYKNGSTPADVEINRQKEKIEKLIKQVYTDRTLVPNGLIFC